MRPPTKSRGFQFQAVLDAHASTKKFAIPADVFRQPPIVPSWIKQVEHINTHATAAFTRLYKSFDFDRLARMNEMMLSTAQRMAQTYGPFFEYLRHAELLKEAGWLPHSSIPHQMLQASSTPEELSASLSEFFSDNWQDVRSQIEADIVLNKVDDENALCLTEALDCHERRYYRSVCRLLFPEIERVARSLFHAGSYTPITSMRSLRDFAGNMPLSEAPFEFFRRLEMHMYEHVTDDADRTKFANDPVPNRHAAIHGHVVYSSMQNSLNTIFMMQFVLQMAKLIVKGVEGVSL